MSTEAIIQIIVGVIVTALSGLVINMIKDQVTMKGQISSLETNVEWIKRSFEMLGGGIMKSLHSPDDHLGLDGLVDKYTLNNDDLPMEDWLTVAERTHVIAHDFNRAREDRLIAALAEAFARHKLIRFAGHPQLQEFLSRHKKGGLQP